jgi:uncharacterized Fe-S cluster protein YjdI/CDGSH-type Zn-finger protein
MSGAPPSGCRPMADPVKRYPGKRVEVTFDGRRCLHAARCVSGLPDVFDAKRRPWILPDRAPAEQVAEVVRRCPSGALHYKLVDGDPEAPTTPTQVSARDGEPLWLRGDLRIDTGEGPVAETRAALCRCGATANAPFCDGTGDCRGWHERAAELDGTHSDPTSK